MKRTTLLLLLLAIAVLTGCTTGAKQATTADEPTTAPNALPTTGWQDIPLTDVNTGATYTIAELDKPLLLESFAIWCPNCLRQQKTIKEFHEELGEGVTIIAIDVDPNEDAAAVKDYASKHGFTWRYSVAPTDLTQQLIDEFGPSVVTAPQEPIILVCDEGAPRLLKRGHKSIDELREELNKGCPA